MPKTITGSVEVNVPLSEYDIKWILQKVRENKVETLRVVQLKAKMLEALSRVRSSHTLIYEA